MKRTTVSNRASFGTMRRPVRTNLPNTSPHGALLTNSPDAWELDQMLPVGWMSAVADDGAPPSWWIGESIDDGWSPIGPHGPFLEGAGMPLPVVTRATSLVVDPITAAPVRVIDTDDPSNRPPAPRWLTDPQLLRPDSRFERPVYPLPMLQRLPRSEFWRDLLACALWWGKAFLWFQTDAAGEPVAGTLRILHPSFVTADRGGMLVGDNQHGVWFDSDGFATVGGIGQRIVMFRNPHGPLGVFAANPDVFKLGRRMVKYKDSTFGAGVPAGYLKVTNPAPITQPQADDLRQRWMAAHGGDARSIAVLNSSTEFHPIQFDPVQLALAENTRLVYSDVAYAFNMAPETLGITMGNSATYSNVEQWFDAHSDFCLSPWISMFQGVTSSLLPGRQETRVNLDAFTLPSWSSWAATAVQLVQAGIFTRDELRAERGYPPLPANLGDADETNDAKETADDSSDADA